MIIPGALVAGMLGSLAGGIVLAVFRNQSLIDSGSAFFGSFVLAFVAGLIAPTKRSKTTLAFASVIALLALLTFVLSVATDIQVFADRRTLDKVLIPVSQILGALYAAFLFPPIIIRGTTLERFWRELIALGTVVVMIGILISVVGVFVGFFGRTWVGLTTGLGVFAVGVVTWLFPYCHLLFRIRKAQDFITDSFKQEPPNQRIDGDRAG